MGQHSESRYGLQDSSHRRVTAGPVAVEPRPKDVFVDAVVAGGGVVEPLSATTKGLVWLSERNADQLSAILHAHPGIEWVQLPWAGVDAFAEVLRDLATKPEDVRPVVTSAKGAYSEPVAEHALALTLAVMRELPNKVRHGKWYDQRTGLSLFERRVVVIGAGGVAQAIVDLLQVFRCDITVVRRDPSILVPGATRTVSVADWRTVLPETDVVIVAAASTPGTRHMLGEEEFALLPDHAVLVNIARGPLVDTDALVRALQSGSLLGAGLDVTDPEPLPEGHPLFDSPNCVITSHSADTPEMTAPLLAARVTWNTRAFLRGEGFRGVVSPELGY